MAAIAADEHEFKLPCCAFQTEMHASFNGSPECGKLILREG
jgi:hypothetical protein